VIGISTSKFKSDMPGHAVGLPTNRARHAGAVGVRRGGAAAGVVAVRHHAGEIGVHGVDLGIDHRNGDVVALGDALGLADGMLWRQLTGASCSVEDESVQGKFQPGARSMCFVRSTFAAVSIVVIATSGAAVAQSRVPSAQTSSTVDDVSKWTAKHWNQAKAKWAKEKVTPIQQ
jgi:hypothetical protein